MNWINQHKFLSFFIFVVGVIALFILANNIDTLMYPQPGNTFSPSYSPSYSEPRVREESLGSAPNPFGGIRDFAPGNTSYSESSSDSYSGSKRSGDGRMTIKSSDVSLLVENVPDTADKIATYAADEGGFLVSKTVHPTPESPWAEIIIRVPQSKMDKTRQYLSDLSIRVVSEKISGYDITDEYQDISSRLSILRKNLRRFEEIMEKATDVQDILQTQNEIFNLQSQIDYFIGQQESLKKQSELSLITIQISSDEMALPYMPQKSWRPGVIFKIAVRGLITFMYLIGSIVIWIVVFSVLWGPALALYLYIKKRKKAQSSATPQ